MQENCRQKIASSRKSRRQRVVGGRRNCGQQRAASSKENLQAAKTAARNGRESHMGLDSPLWIRDNSGYMRVQALLPEDSLLQVWTVILKNRWEKYDKWALLALIMWCESHRLDVSKRAALDIKTWEQAGQHIL